MGKEYIWKVNNPRKENGQENDNNSFPLDKLQTADSYFALTH